MKITNKTANVLTDDEAREKMLKEAFELLIKLPEEKTMELLAEFGFSL